MDVDDATAKLLSLIDMGFDIPEAESALESASGNLETAISILTSARSVNAVPTVIRGEESPSLSGQFVTTEAFPRYPQDTTNEENVDAYQNFRSDQISSNSGERSERECCWDWKLFLGTVMFFSAIMIICGSFWMAWIFQNYSECGTSLASAKFTIVSNTTTRVLSGNSCPGYDWTGQSTPAVAGDISFEYEIPLNPVNCTSPQWVGIGGPVFSHIGYALNGVQIFSPVDDSGDNAITYEHTSFDDCGGHVHAQELEIDKLFPHTKPPGGYHCEFLRSMRICSLSGFNDISRFLFLAIISSFIALAFTYMLGCSLTHSYTRSHIRPALLFTRQIMKCRAILTQMATTAPQILISLCAR